jgi:hypothetical protein
MSEITTITRDGTFKGTGASGNTSNAFKSSVAAEGDIVAYGLPYLDSKGAVYIFKTSDGGTTWTEMQKIVADDGANNDYFGASIAISGNYLCVGAPGANTRDVGAAYFFKTTDGGTSWTQKAKVTHSGNHGMAFQFGKMVSMDGNVAAICGRGYDDWAYDVGAAYIFKTADSGESWTTKMRIVHPSSTDKNRRFASNVCIKGNYLLIKEKEVVWNLSTTDAWENLDNVVYRTSLYEVPNLGAAVFGWSIATDGNYLVVGAPYENSPSNSFWYKNGCAIVYKLDSNGDWIKKARIETSFGGAYKYNFTNVAVKGNRIIARASNGRIFIFETTDSGETWTETSNTAADSADVLGISQGNHVAIGTNFAVISRTDDVGVYKLSGGSGSGSGSSNNTTAVDLSIQTADIDVLKAVSFSNKSNGKGNPDATARSKIKSLITGESNATNKRKKRRAALKLLFERDTEVSKMVIPKEDLDLPTAFKKTNALVVKAGETFNITDLNNDEGFYTVLDNEETVSITTDNTTLTFTRQDVGDNELYTVNATSWTDIVINSDSVSTGTFTDSDNTGTLGPDDSVTIDGRIFIIGSVADGGASGSGGDPYVFPLKSNTPVKLPNKPAVYRMFEQGDNYVNVEVGRVTDEHKLRMFEYAKMLTPVTHNIVIDGYFYQKAFISAEGHKLTLDYTTKKSTSDEESMKFFSMKQNKKLFDCGEFKEEVKCWTVSWTTKENKKIQVQLMFFPNPHIENGINVIPSTLKNSTGLIVDNYKPKLMELPSLTTEKFGKLHRRLAKAKNMRQKMNIKGKNEKWVFN